MDVAIITGGTRGIGGAIATALARRQVRLVLNGRKEDDEVRALLQDLGQLTMSGFIPAMPAMQG